MPHIGGNQSRHVSRCHRICNASVAIRHRQGIGGTPIQPQVVVGIAVQVEDVRGQHAELSDHRDAVAWDVVEAAGYRWQHGLRRAL